MLERITVKNIGCFDESGYTAEFKEETVIVGPNNSGKSMLLAGFNLLRYSILATPSWSTEFYSLVNYESAVHLHEAERGIYIAAVIDGNEYEMAISKGPTFSLKFKGNPFTRSKEHTDTMQRIWYISPKRASLPYLAQVQPSGSVFQPLNPDGSNVINYLLQRFTDRDEKWNLIESWFKKIDPEMLSFKTPVRGSSSSLELMMGNVPINASLQGSGIQNVACVLLAVAFSPEASTILIEEPEICLHPRSQESLIDMFNDAVINHNKQIIFSTHSWDSLLPFISDIGEGKNRGASHIAANPEKFKLLVFNKVSGKPTIQPYDIAGKKYSDVRDYFKTVWG